MKKNTDLTLDILENAGDEIVEEMSERYSFLTPHEKDRIFRIAEKKLSEKTVYDFRETVSGVERYRKPRIYKFVAVACIVAVMLVSGTFAVLLKQPENIENTSLLSSENNAYSPDEISTVLEEYGFETEIPHYLPDGFSLTDQSDNPKIIQFIYETKRKSINICYWKNMVFPESWEEFFGDGEEMKTSETKINGHTARRFETVSGNNVYIVSQKGEITEIFSFENISRTEIQKIIESVK